MREALLRIVEDAKAEISVCEDVIANVKRTMIKNCEFSEGQKVNVFYLDWQNVRTGEVKQAFIAQIRCNDNLEFRYDFLAVKKNGEPSKNSAGIRNYRIELEAVEE